MASELYVETLKGLTSGANANTVTMGSGQTLYAPGHVIQVVQGTSNASASYSNPTYQTYYDGNATVSITPSSTSSKVLVMLEASCQARSTSLTEIGIGLRLRRGTDVIFTTGDDSMRSAMQLEPIGSGVTDLRMVNRVSVTYLDSPNTTSEITYNFQGSPFASTATMQLGGYAGAYTQFTLLEIAG